MQYRSFGSLDFRVSALGFGAMRLPTLGEPSQIDEPEAIRMIRHAIDKGVNYLDTAYRYHGGNSERVVGKALRDGYRQKIKLATKLPVNEVKEPADFDRIFEDQLEKLQTKKIDFYLLHNLDMGHWIAVRDMGYTKWAEKAVADGRIGHLGFSFHSGFSSLKKIIDGYDGWTLCQIQYNYLDIENQAGTKGLRYAAEKGLAVVVMEPLLGGRLAAPPDSIQEIWKPTGKDWSPPEWGLQWVWNHPEVATVLSGMSTMGQLEENLAAADRSGPSTLTEAEAGLFTQAREMYKALYPVPCTQCNYCMPCPNGVAIPHNMLNFNRGVAMKALPASRAGYGFTSPKARADKCIQCRQCEEKCPQKIRIADWMGYIHEVLGNGASYDPALAPQP